MILIRLFRKRLELSRLLILSVYDFGDKWIRGHIPEWLDWWGGRIAWIDPDPEKACAAARSAIRGAFGRASRRGDAVALRQGRGHVAWAEVAQLLSARATETPPPARQEVP